MQPKEKACRGQSMPAMPARGAPILSASPAPTLRDSPRADFWPAMAAMPGSLGKSKLHPMPGFVPGQEKSNASIFDLGFSKMY